MLVWDNTKRRDRGQCNDKKCFSFIYIIICVTFPEDISDLNVTDFCCYYDKPVFGQVGFQIHLSVEYGKGEYAKLDDSLLLNNFKNGYEEYLDSDEYMDIGDWLGFDSFTIYE